MPKKDYDLVHLAGLVKAERSRFAEIYDLLAQKHGGNKLMLLPYFYPPPPPGAPALLVAFVRANEEGWIDELFSELLACEAMADPSVPIQPQAQRFALQKISRPDLGFQDVELQSAGAEKAKRRVCLLTITANGRQTYGTGFLVGPQMILTSWHVIEALLDPLDPGKPSLNSEHAIAIRFDYRTGSMPLSVGVCQDWLVSSSVAHAAERGQAGNAFSTDMPSEGFESCLDYAVIRISAPVGRERGYYRLDQRRKPKIKSLVTIYQHPNGDMMQSAPGASCALWPKGIDTRLRHDANTTGGSSGGLVLDAAFEPVALHQGGITREDDSVINSAIPTSCIAMFPIQFDSVIGVDPIWSLQPSGWPVFSRVNFQNLILEGVVGKTRIVIVVGDPRSGKSFTTAILRDRLGQTEHFVVELSSRLLPTSARDMASLILAKAGVSPSDIAALPSSGDADTAPDAWVRDVLTRDLLTILKKHAGARQVWLVLDDLDVAPLPHTGSLVLIERLLNIVADDNFLRFILIGGSRYVNICPPAFTQTDQLDRIDNNDIHDTILRQRNACGTHVTDDPATQAKAIVAFATESSTSYIEQLVAAYLRIVGTGVEQAAA
jgi:V8-like Glu-specific endopeptidase